MKKITVSLSLFNLVFAAHAAQVANIPPPIPGQSLPNLPVSNPSKDKIEISSTGQNLYEFAYFVFHTVLKAPFLFSGQFKEANIQVAFEKRDLTKENALTILCTILDANGFTLSKSGGFWVVLPAQEKKPEQKLFIYKPLHRPVQYLQSNVAGLVEGSFAGSGNSSGTIVSSNSSKPSSSGTSVSSNSGVLQGQDTLLFKGTDVEIERLKKYLASIDTKPLAVNIKIKFLEISSGQTERNGIKFVTNLLSSKVQLNFAGTSGNVLQIGDNFRLIADILESQNDISILSEPQLTINSGVERTLKVITKLPYQTVSVSGNGMAQTSFNFLEAGTSLTVKADVGQETVTLDLNQDLSDQVQSDLATTAPAVMQRSFPVFYNLKPGDAIMIGGLKYTKKSKLHNTIFGIPIGKQFVEESKEIVTIVYIDSIEK